MQTNLPTIISDSYVLVIQKTTFDRKVSKWFASTNWSPSFLFPHPSHMPWLSDSICETSDSKKVVRNEKMGSHEFHEEVIDIQVFKDGSGWLPVRGFGASEPKTGPGWVQIPGWARQGVWAEMRIPNQSLTCGSSRNLLNYETSSNTGVCWAMEPRRPAKSWGEGRGWGEPAGGL